MNYLEELKHSDTWLDYLCLNNHLERATVDKAMEIFTTEGSITGDYEGVPLRLLRNTFTAFLRGALKENKEIISFKAKLFYSTQSSEKQAYESFKGILFGENKYKHPLYHILAIPEQLTGAEFDQLAPRIKYIGWDKFVDILHTIESNEKYTAGQTNLLILITKWLNF